MRRRTCLLFAMVGIAALSAACSGDGSGTGGAAQDGPRPNVVVIMTDDQTADSLAVMANTRHLIADEGTTYDQGIATFPLCCPARAQFLTGQYAHNNGVRDNAPPDGGYPALDDAETLPVWLQRSGYATAHVGKYLNAYTLSARPLVPPGWDHWFALVDPTATHYVDYDVVDDGRVVHYGSTEADYQTDVLADDAVDQVHRLASGDQPFFLEFWPAAPHTGTGPGAVPFSPSPAPRHLGHFSGTDLPPSPARDEVDIADKPSHVAGLELILNASIIGYNQANGTELDAAALTRLNYQRYLESLLAVDEAVARLVGALDAEGVLDRTVIVFVSDNGWSFGEHRIHFAKVLPYENVLRVPLLARGPGFEAGTTVDGQVALIDLPATILAATGASAPLALDGRPLPGGPADEPDAARALLLESPPRGSGAIPHYEGVRTDRYTYVEYDTGELELYDRHADPDELANVAGDPTTAGTRRALATLLDQLRECVGTGCQIPVPAGL